MPSPLQISHLKEFQQPNMDNSTESQILNKNHACGPPENPLNSGMSYIRTFGFVVQIILSDEGLMGG